MGDIGDYWNEHRAFKRATRSQWIEYSSPGCQFGGNPVKVAPGETCRHCGVVASGQRGSDVTHARRKTEYDADRETRKEEDRKRRLALRTCRTCSKIFGNEQSRVQHERDKHPKLAKH